MILRLNHRVAARPKPGLIHHSDRGVQSLSIRYTERLAEAGAWPRLAHGLIHTITPWAEAVNSLYRAEVIRKTGRWRSLEQVELATVTGAATGSMCPDWLGTAVPREVTERCKTAVSDPRSHDAYHLDLVSGQLTLLARNPGNVTQWVADRDFVVRAAWAAAADGGYSLLVRDTDASDWRSAGEWQSDEALTSWPVAFTGDRNTLLLRNARHANTAGLVALDVPSGTLTLLAEDPTYDVTDVVLHPDTRAVQAVISERERRDWIIVDPAIAPDIARLRALKPGDLSVTSRYDRQSQLARPLFINQPDLTDYTLAKMEPITFAARDGLTVHGYLTLPPGTEPRNLPLVLNVHGGPWTRNTWGYNPDAQWFANRGYACL